MPFQTMCFPITEIEENSIIEAENFEDDDEEMTNEAQEVQKNEYGN